MKQGWITYSNGDKWHYVDDIVHNDEGPAVFRGRFKAWYRNGVFHREGGPAIENYNGNMFWWYKGQYIGNSLNGFSQKKFEQWLKIKVFL